MGILGRSAELSIENNTEMTFTLLQKDCTEGKFERGKEPPVKIAAGQTGSFEVVNTKAGRGVKGFVSYMLGDEKQRVTFYWCHPHEATDSAYTLATEPAGLLSYFLSPGRPEGHHQKVCYHVYEVQGAFDTRDWMAALLKETEKESIPLRSLLLPGTHDSGSYAITGNAHFALDYESMPTHLLGRFEQPWACAQEGTLEDQLNAGIRYLDLRVSNGRFLNAPVSGKPIHYIKDGIVAAENAVESGFFLCHAFASVKLEDALRGVRRFLAAHPQEVVVINIQHLYNFTRDDCKELMHMIQAVLGGPDMLMGRGDVSEIMLQWNKDPMKNRVILFVDQLHMVEKAGQPSAGKSITEEFPDLLGEFDCIWPADRYLYNPYSNSSSIEALKNALAGYIKQAEEPCERDKFFVLQGIIGPQDIGKDNKIGYVETYPDSLESCGNLVSPQVMEWICNEWNTQDLNITIIDWAANSLMTQLFYAMNLQKNKK